MPIYMYIYIYIHTYTYIYIHVCVCMLNVQHPQPEQTDCICICIHAHLPRVYVFTTKIQWHWIKWTESIYICIHHEKTRISIVHSCMWTESALFMYVNRICIVGTKDNASPHNFRLTKCSSPYRQGTRCRILYKVLNSEVIWVRCKIVLWSIDYSRYWDRRTICKAVQPSPVYMHDVCVYAYVDSESVCKASGRRLCIYACCLFMCIHVHIEVAGPFVRHPAVACVYMHVFCVCIYVCILR
jgi:hypothetical protein